MSLTDQVQEDFKWASENLDHWAVEITFLGKANSGVTPFVVPGFHNKHHTAYNELGKKVNTRNASVTVSEATLTAAAAGQFDVRTEAGEVDMISHVVQVEDSTKTSRQYIVTQQYPDEKIGCIVLILARYAGT